VGVHVAEGVSPTLQSGSPRTDDDQRLAILDIRGTGFGGCTGEITRPCHFCYNTLYFD